MYWWFVALNIFVSYTIKMLEGNCLVSAGEEVILFIELERVMMLTNQLDAYTLRFLLPI